jgi:Fe-S cluster assembly ATP-binding protein
VLSAIRHRYFIFILSKICAICYNFTMLEIKNLYVKSNNKQILNGLNLSVEKGQVHIVIGPNGSGKSTLAKTIMGLNDAEITDGEIRFKKKLINDLKPYERAHLGIFLANQYPIEIPGVNLANFLRLSYNSKFEDKKLKLSPIKFQALLKKKLELVGFNPTFLTRNLNEGFSGGEKKKSEILQMAVLEPELAILDETDSGLDIDSLGKIFTAIKKIKKEKPSMSLIIITHYERILKFIKPDKISLLNNGKIVKDGGIELFEKVQKYGFKKVLSEI